MTREEQEFVPTIYEIKIRGRLDKRWADWFGGMTFTYEDEDTTTLRGIVPDQAALYGFLSGVRDLGLPLISVQQASPTVEEEE